MCTRERVGVGVVRVSALHLGLLQDVRRVADGASCDGHENARRRRVPVLDTVHSVSNTRPGVLNSLPGVVYTVESVSKTRPGVSNSLPGGMFTVESVSNIRPGVSNTGGCASRCRTRQL